MSLNGIDISHIQTGINLDAVPADFVIVKVTQGTWAVISDCDRQFQQAVNAGKQVGIYHYAEGGDVEAEVDFFIANASGYFGKAIVFLDWEAADNAAIGNSDWAIAWCDLFETKTGIKPALYMSGSVAADGTWSKATERNLGLWEACYSGGCTGYNNGRRTFGGEFTEPMMLQYTSDGYLDGYGSRLDLNEFYGDVSAWRSYFGDAPAAPVYHDTTAPTAKNVRIDRAPVCYADHFGVWVDDARDEDGGSGIDCVIAAVWTAGNGQDDLKWYQMSRPANTPDGLYNVSVDLKKHGLYNDVYIAHVWAKDKAGNQRCVGKAETKVLDKIPDGSCTVSVEKERIVLPETQTITIKDLTAPVKCDKINVACYLEGASPVWNQGDVVLVDNGVMTATLDMSKRGNVGGKFKVDVYGYNKDAEKNIWLGGTFFYGITQAEKDAEQDALIAELTAKLG